MIEELDCELYVNYDRDDLIDVVAQILDAPINSGEVEHRLVNAYIGHNKQMYSETILKPGTEFLHYPQYIELEPTKIAKEDPFIELVIHLIQSLRKQCGEVVAACRYEDRLP